MNLHEFLTKHLGLDIVGIIYSYLITFKSYLHDLESSTRSIDIIDYLQEEFCYYSSWHSKTHENSSGLFPNTDIYWTSVRFLEHKSFYCKNIYNPGEILRLDDHLIIRKQIRGEVVHGIEVLTKLKI